MHLTPREQEKLLIYVAARRECRTSESADRWIGENGVGGITVPASAGSIQHDRGHQRYLYASGRRVSCPSGALSQDRILGVEAGGCPHTVIREDASHNQEVLDDLLKRHPDGLIMFIESGGDNLAATFSLELADRVIYVIDVAAGGKIPRKGGPGITRSDLLVINKIDSAHHVGADLAVMERDSRRMRGDRPFVFMNLMSGEGLDSVVGWVEPALFMNASAAIADSLLRQAFDGQARPSQPRQTVSSMPRFLGALRARLAT